ncbi:hypothetical protein IEQ34_025987 [Dendrobium chrysotoxum]|uniref:F-ATPase protein 6 n=1 Tax=Dendrobium chrysotoxum TaxID=161865 RepID=A0AAV7FMR0_DENCH|nr:hypothetical protein IEQ34_025987 [Dendrobium chrysotoxum]
MFDFFRIDDLTINGVQGEAYRDALDLAGIGPSPLEQFAILPVDSYSDRGLFFLIHKSIFVYAAHSRFGPTSDFFCYEKRGGEKLIHDFRAEPGKRTNRWSFGNVKQKFSPRISVTFTFSLFRNPQGMIPFSFTVTSHFLITLALSFSIFIGITIVGFKDMGFIFLASH